MLGWCFFFNDTATTEIYTLSLHDALPISPSAARLPGTSRTVSWAALGPVAAAALFALMATVTWLQMGLGPAAWERLVPLLPLAIGCAAFNALGEEVVYRSGPLATLVGVAGPRPAVLPTSVQIGSASCTERVS